MKRRTRNFGLGVGLLAVMLGGFVGFSSLTPQTLPTVDDIDPSVTVDVAAEEVSFTLSEGGEALPPNLNVRLTLATPAGPLVAEAVTTGEVTRLTLPYVRAGLTPYQLSVGDVVLEGAFSKAPGPPVTPLTLNIGARAAQVTLNHDPALVLHPLDAQENVSDMPVLTYALYPGGEVWERTLTPHRLIAWTFIPTGDDVGTLKVSAVSGDARGERGEVDLLPGEVSAATFAPIVDSALASGRDVWRLELSGAEDANGNRAGDGAAVSFVGGGEGRDLFLTRPLIQGAQPLVLPSYPEAGAYSVQARAGSYRSDALPLEAEPLAVAEMPLRWSSLTPPQLELGPVLGTSGALVDDGTLVKLSFHGSAGKLAEFSAPLQDGWLRWTLPPRPEGATILAVEIGSHFDYLPVHSLPMSERP